MFPVTRFEARGTYCLLTFFFFAVKDQFLPVFFTSAVCMLLLSGSCCVFSRVKMYLFCEKLFSSFFASCFVLHSGHCSLLFPISCFIHFSHRVCEHGSNLGVNSLFPPPYSLKQTGQESRCSRLSGASAMTVLVVYGGSEMKKNIIY